MATGANLGVRFKVTIPKFILPHLDLLDNASIGIVITQALRSAGRPAAVALKSILKAELTKSEQSTGATERAVSIKFGRSKSNPNKFYLVVGIDTKHFEIHTTTVPDGKETKLRKGRGQRGAGLFAVQMRFTKKGKGRSKQVFSRFRDSGRIKAMGGRPFKRFPRKYFHLINNGFNHHRGGRVEGYKFLEKLKAAVGNSIQQVFNERLKNLIVPVIKREIRRKLNSVLK